MYFGLLCKQNIEIKERYSLMIAYGDNIKVFCGNSNPAFAETVCKELGIPMGNGTVKTFADGEVVIATTDDLT